MKLVGLTLTAGALMMLSSCSLVQQQTQKAEGDATETVKKPTKKATSRTKTENVQPTPEQMETAVQSLQENGDNLPSSPISEGSPMPAINDEAPMPGVITEATSANASEVIPGGLRMGRFAPPEEAVSSSDNDMPAPNSVELHGFRSPNLKGGTLPMNINGKINKPE